METLTRVHGIALPMLRQNIDTDQIIPVVEMTRVTDYFGSYDRWAEGLFAYWRYADVEARTPNPDFVLNQEPWRRAKILLADRNFGCGSSREGAPMALRGYGFRSIIAPSFAGIFYGNCFRHGLLPVELPIETIGEIARQVEASGGTAEVAVDLERMEVTAPDGTIFAFKTPAPLRQMLLEGMDEIDRTLSDAPSIEAFRMADRKKRPWVYRPGADA
jgi:3-isopropylmalate/(R)-2-methylmalate dehydratase small subunit